MLCNVCGQKAHARQLCVAHYHAWRRHGDPLVNGRIRHGGWRWPEYRVWQQVIQRCENPKSQVFAYYGGRGITVCERWRASFENFLADMGRRPNPDYSLDRRDNDGNYEPGNCRWATHSEQQRNKRPLAKAVNKSVE